MFRKTFFLFSLKEVVRESFRMARKDDAVAEDSPSTTHGEDVEALSDLPKGKPLGEA
jgi:hypothetical protein